MDIDDVDARDREALERNAARRSVIAFDKPPPPPPPSPSDILDPSVIPDREERRRVAHAATPPPAPAPAPAPAHDGDHDDDDDD